MVEFSRTINASEVKHTYLNLTDDAGRTYGSYLPAHKTKMAIIDQNGRMVIGQKHGKSQLRAGIKKWSSNNQVAAGDVIRIQYDAGERHSGLPVVHLHLQARLVRTEDHVKEGQMSTESDSLDDFMLDSTADLLATLANLQDAPVSFDWNRPVSEHELADGRRYAGSIGEGTLLSESLPTLADWERYLLPQALQVEILGELPITEEDGTRLARLFGQLLERYGLSQSERRILHGYRAAFAVFLVMQGIYRFRAGDFWSGVGDAIGQDLDANWRSRLGQLFEANVRTLGLNPFLDFPVHAHRFVSRILGHGGIPNYCLDDFFNNMLRPAVTRDLYSEMSAEELIDEWLLRSSGRHYVDRPVLRFMEFGGQVALDFVERCREMAREFLDSGLVPGAEEIGLPLRVVEAFHDWAVERGGLDPSQTEDDKAGRLRLRRPQILLDPWGEGLTLHLPPQQVPATLSQSEITWQARAGEREFKVPVRIRRSGFDLQTNAESLVLDAPAVDYGITLLVDGQVKRSWRYRGPDEERPLLAFDGRTGALLRAGPSLPGRSLWLLYPSEAELEVTGEGVLLEEFPRLPWGWAEFRGQAWDLTRATGLAVHKDDQPFAIAIRPDEEAQRPRLVGGDLFGTDIAGSAVTPLYVRTPPSARIPLVGRTRLLDELTRWRLTLRSNWAAHPERNVTLPLSDLQPYLRQEDGCVELPLGAC